MGTIKTAETIDRPFVWESHAFGIGWLNKKAIDILPKRQPRRLYTYSDVYGYTSFWVAYGKFAIKVG